MVINQLQTLNLANLILSSGKKIKEHQLDLANRSLIDYLASYAAGKRNPHLKQVIAKLHFQDKALLGMLNGLISHYQDLDDVQADFRGHPSAVIYSALFAVSQRENLRHLRAAFVVGVELAGRLGKLLNPALVKRGWHSTSVIGSLAATAALAFYKQVTPSQLVNMLSIAASQSSGFLFQEGTDAKPLQAGLAARNAITAWQMTIAGVTASGNLFANSRGFGQVLVNQNVDFNTLTKKWLDPGEIEAPGMWYKQFPICSAAVTAYNAAQQTYRQGIKWIDSQQVILHYPVMGDQALTYRHPKTGIEGKFSPEYIIWLVLNHGDINETDFTSASVPSHFRQQADHFQRKHDLISTDPTERPVEIELIDSSGKHHVTRVNNPHGSPKDPLTTAEIEAKLNDLFQPGQLNHFWKLIGQPTTNISHLKEAFDNEI